MCQNLFLLACGIRSTDYSPTLHLYALAVSPHLSAESVRLQTRRFHIDMKLERYEDPGARPRAAGTAYQQFLYQLNVFLNAVSGFTNQ